MKTVPVITPRWNWGITTDSAPRFVFRYGLTVRGTRDGYTAALAQEFCDYLNSR